MLGHQFFVQSSMAILVPLPYEQPKHTHHSQLNVQDSMDPHNKEF